MFCTEPGSNHFIYVRTHLRILHFPLVGHEPGGGRDAPVFVESGLNHFIHPVFLALCQVWARVGSSLPSIFYVRTYFYSAVLHPRPQEPGPVRVNPGFTSASSPAPELGYLQAPGPGLWPRPLAPKAAPGSGPPRAPGARAPGPMPRALARAWARGPGPRAEGKGGAEKKGKREGVGPGARCHLNRSGHGAGAGAHAPHAGPRIQPAAPLTIPAEAGAGGGGPGRPGVGRPGIPGAAGPRGFCLPSGRAPPARPERFRINRTTRGEGPGGHPGPGAPPPPRPQPGSPDPRPRLEPF